MSGCGDAWHMLLVTLTSLEDLQRARCCADDVRRRAKEWEREAMEVPL